MSTYDNAPPLDGFAVPARDLKRCCGEWQATHDCGVCGNPMPDTLRIAPNIVLGTE